MAFTQWLVGFTDFIEFLADIGSWFLYYCPVLAFPLLIWVNVVIIRLVIEVFG